MAGIKKKITTELIPHTLVFDKIKSPAPHNINPVHSPTPFLFNIHFNIIN